MLKLGWYGTHNGRVVRLVGRGNKQVMEAGKPIEKVIYSGYLCPKMDPRADAGENGEWEEDAGPGRIAKFRTPNVNKSHAFDLAEEIEPEEAAAPVELTSGDMNVVISGQVKEIAELRAQLAESVKQNGLLQAKLTDSNNALQEAVAPKHTRRRAAEPATTSETEATQTQVG